jgi:uncharacterized membrane protein
MSQTTGLPGIVQPADASLVTYTHIIYALHALSVLMGVVTSASIVFSFVAGVPSIVAVVMNYARRSETRGTILESHFRWQIRTFWFALLWMIIVYAVGLPLVVLVIGLPILLLGTVANGVWIVYRVVRGWLALRDQRPMYV